ncbi:type I phosphodiesterase/nucleotide pyrophosphatase [Ferroglobus placidus DSM 10642]|uniref:Type I phosphodiesterase/nucleotide pyrophosphatase n=1 Tax=Ferroglobus placidus (strain DSM 10642 / AEDII12DO) TaxID=589924 RepID=D3RZY7_FERPA|nr:alkaline phosphatase family protein [Ferroglobus placidus]ADC66050.1 type I phosphodiesterase/nucleotide pyrophosphatase [Ferroglobus placidus DSM 10642]
MKRIVVVGIDGGSWNILKPMCDRNELKGLKKIIENGSWGFLESTLPPLTAPAWVSFYTGKNPGKHGIFDFVKLENGKMKLNRSKDVKGKAIYEVLSNYGIRSVIIALPLSFPPKIDFNGIMISDFLYPQKEVYPKGSIDLSNYSVYSDPNKSGEELIKDVIETTRSQVELGKKVFSEEDWQFFFILFRETDTILHNFWGEIKNGNSRLLEVFKLVDEFLAWVIERIEDDTTVFVVSDHGFSDYDYLVRINKIFHDKNLLEPKIVKKEETSILETHVKSAFGTEKRRLRIPKIFYKILLYSKTSTIAKKIYRLVFKGREVSYLVRVDYEKSKAYVLTPLSSTIYLKDSGDYDRTFHEVLRLLSILEYQGKKVVKKVFTKNDVYSGACLNDAPDFIVVTNGFILDSGIVGETFERFSQGGYHSLQGIFAAYGKNIKRGEVNAKIYDLFPTILYALDLPIPEDVDGRVLVEIFDEKKDVKHTSNKESEKIRKAISKLKKI